MARPKKNTAQSEVAVAVNTVQEDVTTNTKPERYLSEAELFFITEKCRVMSIEDIAKTLKVDEATVRPHIPEQVLAAPKEKTPMAKMMKHTSDSGKREGPAIMTPGASMFADEVKPKPVRTINGQVVECIHKPLG